MYLCEATQTKTLALERKTTYVTVKVSAQKEWDVREGVKCPTGRTQQQNGRQFPKCLQHALLSLYSRSCLTLFVTLSIKIQLSMSCLPSILSLINPFYILLTLKSSVTFYERIITYLMFAMKYVVGCCSVVPRIDS